MLSLPVGSNTNPTMGERSGTTKKAPAAYEGSAAQLFSGLLPTATEQEAPISKMQITLGAHSIDLRAA